MALNHMLVRLQMQFLLLTSTLLFSGETVFVMFRKKRQQNKSLKPGDRITEGFRQI